MTKRQLIETLEPFTDDVEITILDEGNYKYSPRIFYHMTPDGEGEIILVTNYEPHGKNVELKIRG